MILTHFNVRVNKVISLARLEAADLGHNYIGTEHLLLGLAREGEGAAARLLSENGLSLFRLRELIAIAIQPGRHPKMKRIPLTPRCREVLDDAIRTARARGLSKADTEDVLSALVQDEGGLAKEVLSAAGITPRSLPW